MQCRLKMWQMPIWTMLILHEGTIRQARHLCKNHKCQASCMQLPLMSAESVLLQTVCEGRPEGISQSCAHAPLMVQEGLCLLCSHPHVPHLPAQASVIKSAACPQLIQWHADLCQCQSMSAVSGIALPAC